MHNSRYPTSDSADESDMPQLLLQHYIDWFQDCGSLQDTLRPAMLPGDHHVVTIRPSQSRDGADVAGLLLPRGSLRLPPDASLRCATGIRLLDGYLPLDG